MADDRTGNTRNVATKKADACLCQFAVFLLGLPELPVDDLDRLLKGRELAHGVRDLAAPEWHDALVQTADALLGNDLAPPFSQIS
jgi:hypothetical protein